MLRASWQSCFVFCANSHFPARPWIHPATCDAQQLACFVTDPTNTFVARHQLMGTVSGCAAALSEQASHEDAPAEPERSPGSFPVDAAADVDDGDPGAAPLAAAEGAAHSEQHDAPLPVPVLVLAPALPASEGAGDAQPTEVSPGSRRKLDFAQAPGSRS